MTGVEQLTSKIIEDAKLRAAERKSKLRRKKQRF